MERRILPPRNVIVSVLLILFEVLVASSCSLAQFGVRDSLPWPPSAAELQEVATALTLVLTRSEIPEAKELLTALPSKEVALDWQATSDSKRYFGEWVLDSNGKTLYAMRLRNELIRHQYKVTFSWNDGGWVGSELVVVTFHAMPPAERR